MTFENFKDISKTVLGPLGMFFFTIFTIASIQWVCMQFLAYYCHPFGFWGFISNCLSLGSPVCLAVSNLSVALANHYVSIWSGVAAFCVTWIISKFAALVPTKA